MNAHIEWIEDSSAVGVGATAAKPAQYVDCNIAAPTAAGKTIIVRLQALLGVMQTGFLDAETCAAWRDFTATRPWMKKYPGNFNITNILDTLDGASADAAGKIVHHWKCNGPMITPDCTIVPSRGTGADPCPAGQHRDVTTGDCVLDAPITCGPGQAIDPTTGQCVETPQPTSRRKRKSTVGLLLLASAAVAAIAIAS